ncbi:hypothetical protein [Thaumasiovibrio subtropicus]|uniref:hypothetical protein n=1 Tax=Thaumasiovibrio subtropicus TaxID=1891207 RepID=UPI000B3503CF|nr:hypothetical protein [Thaumasiovibrio subtropicus]
MKKYQFFAIPGKERQQYTYIDMGSSTFLAEKAQLLEAGFEVDGNVIEASTPEEAIEHYRSHFTYIIEDYNNSTVIGGLVTFVRESLRSLRKAR